MTMTWWLGDELADELVARHQLLGSGLMSGDAVITTLRVVAGVPLDLERHVERLRRDASDTGLPVPDAALVRRAAAALARVNGRVRPDHVLRLTATRAAPAPGSAFGSRTELSLLLGVSEPPPIELLTQLTVATVDGSRRPAGIKTLDRSWPGRADTLARRRDADRALLVDGDDVLEGGYANVVVVRDGDATTPIADGRLLPGITRAALLESDVGLRAAPVNVVTLLAADEVVLLSSIAGVVSVVGIQHAAQPMQPVGDGQPGPWAARARQALIAGGWPASWPHPGTADPAQHIKP
jgi:branched-subunit amino acid aminotransferase/4-amino-4-deoxychorismate lyase